MLLMSGCEQATNQSAPATSSEATVHRYGYGREITEPAGEAVFNKACAQCHYGQDPRAPHTSMLRLMSH